EPCSGQRLEAMASSLFRNQPHGLQDLSTRLRATQQPHMLGPSLGEGLPASHLGLPTTLRADNGHQRRGLGHGSTPFRLCLGSAVSDSEGIRRVFHPSVGVYTWIGVFPLLQGQCLSPNPVLLPLVCPWEDAPPARGRERAGPRVPRHSLTTHGA